MIRESALTVVKIGGRIAEDDAVILALGEDLKNLTERGNRVLLVHGGGITISDLQRKYGIEPEFVDGLRMTPPAEMLLVDMALAGAVNKRLVRLLHTLGLSTWGLCGADAGILSARTASGRPESNRTGVVTAVNPGPLELIWDGGYTPVFAPPSMDEKGHGINVNADEAALALAKGLRAAHLVFLSDVPGVMENGEMIHRLTPSLAQAKIDNGVITGGMIPKVKSAVTALKDGVGAVIIGNYTKPGDLDDLLSASRGTRIDMGANM